VIHQGRAGTSDFLTMYPDSRRTVVRVLGELTAETDPRLSGHPSAAVCLVTLSIATEAQVKEHMRWSSAFDPIGVRR
jgi:hypothetical protein